jgi:hypothetical protein
MCLSLSLYMDQHCLFYQLPLLESGTLGTKGNTQVHYFCLFLFCFICIDILKKHNSINKLKQHATNPTKTQKNPPSGGGPPQDGELRGDARPPREVHPRVHAQELPQPGD